MADIIRRSPVRLPAGVVERERREGWEVVLRYEGEGAGPHLVDLSHRTKWDLQDRDAGSMSPGGAAVPKTPGTSILSGGLALNRMNRTQVSIWHLAGEDPVTPTASFTETTDAHALLALTGPEVFSILEHATDLDLAGRPAPAYFQGPVFHIPCQVLVLKNGEGVPGVLLAFSRGYGQAFAEALLQAGKDAGLRPAGEKAFSAWFGKQSP